MRANLANSDGCIVNLPKRSQRLAPLIFVRMPGTSTKANKTTANPTKAQGIQPNLFSQR